MTTERKQTRLYDVLIVLVAISPFWFLASDIDQDEVEKTAVSGGLVAVIAAAQKFLKG